MALTADGLDSAKGTRNMNLVGFTALALLFIPELVFFSWIQHAMSFLEAAAFAIPLTLMLPTILLGLSLFIAGLYYELSCLPDPDIDESYFGQIVSILILLPTLPGLALSIYTINEAQEYDSITSDDNHLTSNQREYKQLFVEIFYICCRNQTETDVIDSYTCNYFAFDSSKHLNFCFEDTSDEFVETITKHLSRVFFIFGGLNLFAFVSLYSGISVVFLSNLQLAMKDSELHIE